MSDTVIDSLIGTPGTVGFGVGVCNEPQTLARLNLQPMDGCDDPSNDNYGNYIHTSTQSIMCYIPAFKYRIGDLPEGSLPTQKWGPNSVQIWSVNDSSAPSNAVIHRAFYDGRKRVAGFFCDKYICSPSSDKNCGVSIKNKAPLSLTFGSDYTPSSQIANCSGRLDDAITASRARGNGFQCMSVFQLGAIRLLTLAHGQTSTNTSYNMWYDSTGAHNGPHGNTNMLSDYDHPRSTWITGANDGGYANKGLTGSCSNFAASAHNGQNCGIVDLKGCVYQVVTGAIATSTQIDTTGTKTIYVLKEDVAIGDLDCDAMYDTNNHQPLTFDTGGSTDWYWDSTQPMITNSTSGFEYQCCGFLPTQRSSSVTDMFEDDYANVYIFNNMFPHFSCGWSRGSYSVNGLWCSNLNNGRSDRGVYHGFRACAY